MVAETFDEVSRLFDASGRQPGLLFDTGHADAGGFDYTKLIKRYGGRIVHIHLKDARSDVMADGCSPCPATVASISFRSPAS